MIPTLTAQTALAPMTASVKEDTKRIPGVTAKVRKAYLVHFESEVDCSRFQSLLSSAQSVCCCRETKGPGKDAKRSHDLKLNKLTANNSNLSWYSRIREINCGFPLTEYQYWTLFKFERAKKLSPKSGGPFLRDSHRY